MALLVCRDGGEPRLLVRLPREAFWICVQFPSFGIRDWIGFVVNEALANGVGYGSPMDFGETGRG